MIPAKESSPRSRRVTCPTCLTCLTCLGLQNALPAGTLQDPRQITYASGLYRDGVDLMAIQRLLGHRWLTTTMRYMHVAADTIEAEYARAAEQAAGRFSTVVPAGR